MRSKRVWLPTALVLAALPVFATGDGNIGILAEAEAGYREDATPARLVAWVRCRALGTSDGVFLQVALCAAGPEVDPVPGLEGVAGANPRTAEELHRLLREDALVLETRSEGGDVRQPGRLLAVRRGHLPTRRIGRDGRLQLDARTLTPLPIEVTLETLRLPEGRHDTYVLAEGIPRLCVTTSCSGGGATIESITSIGEQAPLPRRRP